MRINQQLRWLWASNALGVILKLDLAIWSLGVELDYRARVYSFGCGPIIVRLFPPDRMDSL